VDEARRQIVFEQLSAVLASETFRGSERSRALLAYLVDQALSGEAERLKEYTVGVEALGRGGSFDPRVDPIVRAEASRLRRRLEKYYGSEGRGAPLAIVLPRGSYVPRFENVSGDDAAPAAMSRRGMHATGVSFALGVAVGAAALAVVWFVSKPSAPLPSAQPLEFDVELRSKGTLGSDVGTDAVLSLDGTRVAFVSRGADRRTHLNVRRLDDPRVTELPGTDGARAPFFSPDGGWLGFWADGAVKKVAVDGGSATVIAEASDLLGADWGADGVIVAATRYGVLSSIPAAGGAPSALLDLTSVARAPLWPQLLPGGDRVLVTVTSPNGFDDATLEVVSLRDGERREVLHGGTFGRYIEKDGAGYVLYMNQGTVFALPFDLGRLAQRGAAFPVLEDVAYAPTFGYAQLSVSKTGALAYQRDAGSAKTLAAWVDRAGNAEPLRLPPGRYAFPRLSPDGQRIALVAVASGVRNLLVYEPATDRTTRLHSSPYSAPAWYPDGRALVVGGAAGLTWLPVDPEAEPRPLLTTNAPAVPWSFAPQGTRVAYHMPAADTHLDLWTAPLEVVADVAAAGAPEPFLRTSAVESWPALSPDGRWLAYGSSESGTFEVYVRAFPDDGHVVRISEGGGRAATWARDGRQLLYGTDDGRVMVVAYTVVDGAFKATHPERWTPVAMAAAGVLPTFDLAPNGERILALLPSTDAGSAPAPNHVTFISNLFEKLRP
jgi:serine/threonine-protein kinase